jgi:hypothetical protein
MGTARPLYFSCSFLTGQFFFIHTKWTHSFLGKMNLSHIITDAKEARPRCPTALPCARLLPNVIAPISCHWAAGTASLLPYPLSAHQLPPLRSNRWVFIMSRKFFLPFFPLRKPHPFLMANVFQFSMMFFLLVSPLSLSPLSMTRT